jgi:mercuric ion transport protein
MARTDLTGRDTAEAEDCCGPGTTSSKSQSAGSRPQRGAGGALAWAASIGAAVVASACCWLPALLVALGVGAAGVGAYFESLRPYMLGLLAVLLFVLYRRSYGSRAACAEGEACATDTGARRARRMFWFASAFALVLVTYLTGAEAIRLAARTFETSPEMLSCCA